MMKSRFEPEQWNIQISPLRPRIGIYILHTIPNTLLMKLTKDSVSQSRASSMDDHLLYFHDHLIQQIRSPVKQYKARTGWWQYSKSEVPLLKVKLVFHVKNDLANETNNTHESDFFILETIIKKKKLFRYSGSAWPRTHSQCVREDMYFYTHEKIRDEREGEVLTEVWNLVMWTKSSYFPSRTLLQLYNFYWKGGKLWHNYKRSWYHFSLDTPFVFPLNIKPTCCSAICILCSSRARSCSVVLSTMLLPPTSNLLSIIYGERGSCS